MHMSVNPNTQDAEMVRLKKNTFQSNKAIDVRTAVFLQMYSAFLAAMATVSRTFSLQCSAQETPALPLQLRQKGCSFFQNTPTVYPCRKECDTFHVSPLNTIAQLLVPHNFSGQVSVGDQSPLISRCLIFQAMYSIGNQGSLSYLSILLWDFSSNLPAPLLSHFLSPIILQRCRVQKVRKQ